MIAGIIIGALAAYSVITTVGIYICVRRIVKYEKESKKPKNVPPVETAWTSMINAFEELGEAVSESIEGRG